MPSQNTEIIVIDDGTESGFPSFETTGLPQYMAPMWKKSGEILQRKDGIVPCPGLQTTKVVISFSNQNQPNLVNHKNGFTCQCHNFKNEGICSHAIAVAFRINKLPMLLSSFTNTTNAVQPLIPKQAGRKANETSRKRKAPVDRQVDQMRDPDFSPQQPHEASTASENQLSLVWMKNERTTVCYGCGDRFRKLPSDPPPPYPNNMVLKGKDIRYYRNKQDELKSTFTKQNTFYHVRKSCILRKRQTVKKEQIVLPVGEDIGRVMKTKLELEFGLIVADNDN